MAQQNINFGRFPSDPSADSLRIAFQKAQNNFTELYNNQNAQVTKVYADRGLTQNRTTGDVVLYANISSVTVQTSTNLKVGVTTASGRSATITTYETPLVFDIDPNIEVNSITSNLLIGTIAAASASQPNITSVGTLTSLNVSGNIGASWVNASINGPVVSPGSNNYVILNQSGLLGASSGLTFNGSLLTVGGNVSAGNVSGGNLIHANYFSGPSGTLEVVGNLNASQNVSASHVFSAFNGSIGAITPDAGVFTGVTVNQNLSADGNITSVSGVFFGDGSGLTNVNASNVSGSVATANSVNHSLTPGSYLTGSAFNGSANITFAVDGTSTATANKVAIRDGSGGLEATTFIGNLQHTIANGSYLTGGTFNNSGDITFAVNAATAATASTVVARDSAGNITTNYYIGNGSALTGVVASILDKTLSNGSYITGGNFDGSSNVTIAVDATTTSTANKIVARDSSGNVYANSFIGGSVTTSSLVVEDLSNIHIPGGTTGYFIQNAGNGNLVWSAGGVSGSNTYVQFNDAGLPGGSSNFTYNKYTDMLTVGNVTVGSYGNISKLNATTTANLGSVSNITITGGSSGQYLKTDGSGSLSWSDAALFYNFTTGTSSPNAAYYPVDTVSGFNAYDSTDFPTNYYTGITVKAATVGAQFAVNWDVDNGSNLAPSKFSIRANDDTGATADWSPWANVWMDTNDGTGSGLDADLLDGKHANAFLVIDPDGDGPSIVYSDQNPYINGILCGGGWYLGADGNTNMGLADAKFLNARNGFVNSSYGYYIGNIDPLNSTANYTSTQVIDYSGNVYSNYLNANGVVTFTANIESNNTTTGTLIVTGGMGVSGNINASYLVGNGYSLIATNGANVLGTVSLATSATTAGTVTTASQPNITSVGTLTGLTSSGIVNFASTSNVTLGSNANVHISGGTNGQILTTDGSGSLSWTTVSGGSGTVTSVTAGSYLTGGTITTTGTIAVDATTANTASKIVARDSSGNIYANTIQLASSSTQGITFVPDPGSGSGDTATIKYYIPTSGEQSSLVLATTNDADDHIILNPTGNVGIKNFSPTVALDVTGAILASGDITAFSDATLKTNVVTISNPLEIIKNLRGVDYTRTDTGEEGSGVIAQEVKPHRPMLVKDHNGTLSVNYNGFSGLFIESIKALMDEVETLKAEIKLLKGQ